MKLFELKKFLLLKCSADIGGALFLYGQLNSTLSDICFNKCFANDPSFVFFSNYPIFIANSIISNCYPDNNSNSNLVSFRSNCRCIININITHSLSCIKYDLQFPLLKDTNLINNTIDDYQEVVQL